MENCNSTKYVVLGASAAGINGAATLRRLDPQAEIVLVSEDERVYSRCIMHHYMEGIRSLERLSFVEPDFFAQCRIQWLKGRRAIALDAERNEVKLSDQQVISYDKLLIATGSHSFLPPIEGVGEAANVLGFHDLEDCREIMARAGKAEHIVVLGAGLVGLDAVCGLLALNKKISLIDMKEHMLSIQLDQRAAQAYQQAFAARGVEQHYNVGIQQVFTDAENKCTAVRLSDGSHLPCDLLIIAAGVRANIDFLEGSAVAADRFGLIIDEKGRTNIKNIYGAGDVTGRNPIWPVAVKEGMIAASNMASVERRMTDFFASKATMNFLSVPTMSLGIHQPEDESYTVDMLEDDQGNYKKIIHKNGRIYGAILQGDLSYAGILTQLIRNRIDISKVRKSIFKIDYSDFFHMDQSFEYYYVDED